MADRIMKQGDTWKPLLANMSHSDAGFDLEDAVSITLRMRSRDKTVVISGPMVLEDPVTFLVSYDWDVGDTAVAGVYDAEIEVDWGLGRIETFPNDGYREIELVEELDNPGA